MFKQIARTIQLECCFVETLKKLENCPPLNRWNQNKYMQNRTQNLVFKVLKREVGFIL